MRASDADRDRVADILREALAEGRLTAEEHSDRIDGVYRAKTVGELEPLVRDLPVGAAGGRTGSAPGPSYRSAPHSAAPAAGRNVVAVFSEAQRKGRRLVGRRTNAVAVFGAVVIDLTEAVFDQREIVINATAILGSVEIRVPENITLRGTGTGVLGHFEADSLASPDPDAPVVIVTGAAVLGSVEARPERGKRLKDLHDRMRKEFGH
ncbi:DUF1707 domain-containing protein [Streptomyces sp. NPDC004647]|uniref:DUF1707 SHOCT-like domain-containing protein n=1 Tax=Streptomyces sp. NPDC004647 TaxID=3154671 RepID=UPI0033BFA154